MVSISCKNSANNVRAMPGPAVLVDARTKTKCDRVRLTTRNLIESVSKHQVHLADLSLGHQ